MIHGFHLIWGTYGFWLPNDPRGSLSDCVHAWELVKFGHATKSVNRVDIPPTEYANWRREARNALHYPPVTLTGRQALAAAIGFGRFVRKSGLVVWACSILPEHVHFVVARHNYPIEQVANLLKGAATRQLLEENLHPMQHLRKTHTDRLPSLWAENQWATYLDDEEAIENAIRYVEKNPIREGKPPQKWSFVQGFGGIDDAWTTYH